MPVKQTQNGEVKVRSTTRLQLKSLDAFAKELGYKRELDNQYKPLPFDPNPYLAPLRVKFLNIYKQKPCIDFNTMVRWHNGDFKKEFMFKTLEEILLYHEGLPLGLYNKALSARKVQRVKIQRKKDTTLVVQDHLVEVI